MQELQNRLRTVGAAPVPWMGIPPWTVLARGPSVAFSPDGARVASALNYTVRLWDTATGAAVAILGGHSRWVMSVAFSPDGTRVASASVDHGAHMHVQLWAWAGLFLLGELHMLRRRGEIVRRSGCVLQLDVQIDDHASWWIATICSKVDLPANISERIELAIIEPVAPPPPPPPPLQH